MPNELPDPAELADGLELILTTYDEDWSESDVKHTRSLARCLREAHVVTDSITGDAEYLHVPFGLWPEVPSPHDTR